MNLINLNLKLSIFHFNYPSPTCQSNRPHRYQLTKVKERTYHEKISQLRSKLSWIKCDVSRYFLKAIARIVKIQKFVFPHILPFFLLLNRLKSLTATFDFPTGLGLCLRYLWLVLSALELMVPEVTLGRCQHL